jgi:hypothetical protein
LPKIKYNELLNIKIEHIRLKSLTMDRGKIVAIITGAISIIIAVAYLILVALLDSRGQMIPAPIVEFIFLVIF